MTTFKKLSNLYGRKPRIFSNFLYLFLPLFLFLPPFLFLLAPAGSDVSELLRSLLAARDAAGNGPAAAAPPPPSSGGLDLPAAYRLKEACCQVAESRDAYNAAMAAGPGAWAEQTHTLPDGATIRVGRERLTAGECYFDPALVGAQGPGISEEVLAVKTPNILAFIKGAGPYGQANLF